MRFVFCFLSVVFAVQNTHSATWTKTFGGERDDQGYAVVATSDTGYLVAGYTRSFGSGGSDAWILKVDRNGNLMWQKTLGGTLDDFVYSMNRTYDDGYILTGYTESITTIDKDVWLIKLDSDGDTMWTKSYDIGNEECGYCVKQTADSGYVVVGYSKASSTRSCVLLMKTNAVGGTVWIRQFASFAKNRGYSVCEAPDAGYVIAGFTKESSQCMLVIRTDSTGDVRWTKVFDASYGCDYGGCVRQSPDSCYVIAGIMNSHLHLLKVGEDGDTLWVRSFGSSRYAPENSCFFDFAQDGGCVVVGCCDNNYDVNMQLVKTDYEGRFEWRHIFRGSDYDYLSDYGHCVRETLDGGYIIAGATESYAQAYSPDLWLIRTDPGRDVEEETAAESPREILSLYPNPAVSWVRVTLSPQRASPHTSATIDEVRLTLYDITGREIRTVIDSPADNQVVLHLAGIRTGTYFVKAVIDNQIVTKKLSVVAF